MMAVMAMLFSAAQAMPYLEARNEALYLSDKMAYELNLSMAQYNAVYEINFDYFYSVNRPSEVLGKYWRRRNTDLRYVLSVEQYSRYRAILYFDQPLLWRNNAFSFRVYTRYSNRDLLYYDFPSVWMDYRGGHGGSNYYSGRSYDNGKRPQPSTHPQGGSSWRNGGNGKGPGNGQPAGGSWRPGTGNAGSNGQGNANKGNDTTNKGSRSGSGNNRGTFGGGSQSNPNQGTSNGSTRNAGNGSQGNKAQDSPKGNVRVTTSGGNFGGKR